jgi:hypothetical protein
VKALNEECRFQCSFFGSVWIFFDDFCLIPEKEINPPKILSLLGIEDRTGLQRLTSNNRLDDYGLRRCRSLPEWV